jgi:hypothetical protein
MKATCFACDSGSAGTCAAADSAVDKTKGVVGYVAGVTFDFKQSGDAATNVLKVKDVVYQPNSKGAVGRFFFAPSTTAKLYKTHSTIKYTFGSQTFGSNAICQVFTSSGTAPSTTMSDAV